MKKAERSLYAKNFSKTQCWKCSKWYHGEKCPCGEPNEDFISKGLMNRKFYISKYG